MKITAMLRCRNEARWIGEVLDSVRPLTDQIVVLDDHSTDETKPIAWAHGAAVLVSPYPQNEPDEARDKNYLLQIVRVLKPDYVLCIDGDEVLSAGSAERIAAALQPGLGVFSFAVRYLWNDRLHYRADGVYGRYTRASMFSLLNAGPAVRFRSTRYGCNFHCGNVPAGVKGHGSTVMGADLLHLGYMHAEDRIRKYEWYNLKDPNNQDEDGYRHMVVGDVFPADSQFRHGGPLKVYSLPASKWPV